MIRRPVSCSPGTVLLVLAAALATAACARKQAAVEGKLVDWRGRPVAGVKITAAQAQLVKGYEEFGQRQATTGADGAFRLAGLFPSSIYELKPSSDKWTSDTTLSLQTAPAGETSVLREPMRIAQAFAPGGGVLVVDLATGTPRAFIDHGDGTVTDTLTGLMWATSDNGADITWDLAKRYCEEYSLGGYRDWRMPATGELEGLLDPRYTAETMAYRVHVPPAFHLTSSWVWSSETEKAADARSVGLHNGSVGAHPRSDSINVRALPVRSAK